MPSQTRNPALKPKLSPEEVREPLLSLVASDDVPFWLATTGERKQVRPSVAVPVVDRFYLVAGEGFEPSTFGL